MAASDLPHSFCYKCKDYFVSYVKFCDRCGRELVANPVVIAKAILDDLSFLTLLWFSFRLLGALLIAGIPIGIVIAILYAIGSH